MISYLPPAKEVGKGNVFTGVCQFVHGGGGRLSLVPRPFRRVGYLWSGGVSRGGVSRGRHRGTTKAGGTHPTGMVSCNYFMRLKLSLCNIGLQTCTYPFRQQVHWMQRVNIWFRKQLTEP